MMTIAKSLSKLSSDFLEVLVSYLMR